MTGKGDKQRVIPLSDIALDRLVTFIDEIRPKINTNHSAQFSSICKENQLVGSIYH